MPRKKYSRIKPLQILDGTLHLLMLTCSKMESPNDSVKGDRIMQKVNGIFCRVDDARMAATCKDNDSFACRVVQNNLDIQVKQSGQYSGSTHL